MRWFLDIESWGLDATSRAFAFVCISNETGTIKRTFHDPMDCRGFLESQGDIVVYAHNSFRYDIWPFYTADEIRHSDKVMSKVGLQMVRIDTGHSIVEWRDSKMLIPLSIDAIGDALNLPKGKLHRDFKRGNRRDITQEDIDYCKRDVEIMRNAILLWERIYNEMVGGEEGQYELPLTAASMAYRIWCAQSWPEHWKRDQKRRSRSKKPEKQGQYIRDAEGNVKTDRVYRAWCPSQANADAEKAYAGGRVQVLCEPGQLQEGVRSADANSLFPSVQYEEMFPDIARVRRHWGIEPLLSLIRNDLYCCWADVRLVAGPDSPRFLPNINAEGRRDYTMPVFDGWLAEPEIRHAIDRGYTLERCDQIWYAPAINPFRDFVDRLYRERMRLRSMGDAREYAYKIILNSFYGRLGMRDISERIDRPSKVAEIMEDDQYWMDWELGFYDGPRGEMPYLMARTPTVKSKSTWFGFAAFITSHARVRLQLAIEACGEDILYVDTDSVHFRDTALDQVLGSIPFHNELGGWKMEQKESIPFVRYWEPKAYTGYNADLTNRFVKHKGTTTKDDEGNWLPNAGDLTKPQTQITIVQYRTALRRGIEGGSPLRITKTSRRWGKQE